MPDIQMCMGQKEENGQEPVVCMVRNQCYRYTATPSTYQAWGGVGRDFTPENGCENIINTNKNR